MLTQANFSRTIDLPSCHALSRFVNGFFDGFYPHFPMVHIPTFRVGECEPEILLAMCALGAEFRYENRKAVTLFHAAKSILEHRRCENQRSEVGATSGLEASAVWPQQGTRNPDPNTLSYGDIMREARCAFLLISFATWQGTEIVAREAFNFQSFLARCVRECQLLDATQSVNNDDTWDWHSWIREETNRRIKLFSFAILNLQSLAFDTPPAILADELDVRLPSSCLEWIAPSQERWNRIRRPGFREQMMFQTALSRIMRHPPEPISPNTLPIPSPQANYILIHALIQQILLAYRSLRPYST